MTVCTLQSSKTPRALNHYHFCSGLVKAVLIICCAPFENCCSLLKMNKKVTSVMLQAQYLPEDFLQSLCAKSLTESTSNKAKLSVGEIELVQALK